MPKILNRAKNIVVLILLFTVFPAMFVEGFLAYVYHFSDDEELRLFKQTYDVFYKICMNSAYISLFLTYIASHFISKSQKIIFGYKIPRIGDLEKNSTKSITQFRVCK